MVQTDLQNIQYLNVPGIRISTVKSEFCVDRIKKWGAVYKLLNALKGGGGA